MLAPPAIPAETVSAGLWSAYGLEVAQIDFLPIGADLNTIVYRAVSRDGTAYFVKLRGGVFDETCVRLPHLLHAQGISAVIPPLAALDGRLWGEVETYKLIVYPFVDGRDGYGVPLSAAHWRAFAAALGQLHRLPIPPGLGFRRESYSPAWRHALAGFLEQLDPAAWDDPAARELAAFLQTKRAELGDLLARTARLAQEVRARDLPRVICHTDLHAGNLLIGADDHLYIVDWDAPLLAPKERDLMYVGGAQGFRGHTLDEEEALFYPAYGPTRVDAAALSYYRCARIIEDIAIYCQQLFLSTAGGPDRQQALDYLKSNFAPGGTLAAADREWP